jgi:hypothetical protein
MLYMGNNLDIKLNIKKYEVDIRGNYKVEFKCSAQYIGASEYYWFEIQIPSEKGTIILKSERVCEYHTNKFLRYIYVKHQLQNNLFLPGFDDEMEEMYSTARYDYYQIYYSPYDYKPSVNSNSSQKNKDYSKLDEMGKKILYYSNVHGT